MNSNKVAKATVALAVLALLVFSRGFPVNASSVSATESGCTSRIIPLMDSLLASVNSTKAVEFAKTSSGYLAEAAGNDLSFLHLSADYTFNPTTCGDVRIADISVNFKFVDANVATGNVQSPLGLQVFEDSGISAITGVTVDDATYATPSNSSSWSGYLSEFKESGSIVDLNYVTSYFDMYPIGSNSECYSHSPYECAIGQWSGLDAATFLAQTGATASISCTSGGSCGSYSYVGWFEFPGYDTAAQNCSPSSSYPISAYDELEAVAENGPEWGGASDQWRTYLINEDPNHSWACDSGTITYTPTYAVTLADTIFERPTVNSVVLTIPTWSSGIPTYTNTLGFQYSGTEYTESFYTANNDGYMYQDNMVNSCSGTQTLDITLSSIDSSSDFSETYDTNCGT